MASISNYLGYFALGAITKPIVSTLADKLFLGTIKHDDHVESTCINLSEQKKEKLQKVLDSQYLQEWDISKKKYFLTDEFFVNASTHNDIQDAIENSNKATMDDFVGEFDDRYKRRENIFSKVACYSTISPLVEETIFRYLIQKVALGTLFNYVPLGAPAATCARIAFPAIAFSTAHLINKHEPSLQRHQLFSNFLSGLTAGVAMEKIGLLGAILVHSGSNFAAAISSS